MTASGLILAALAWSLWIGADRRSKVPSSAARAPGAALMRMTAAAAAFASLGCLWI